MKRLLLSAALLFSGFMFAQETEVSVSLQPGYANQVYYKFSTNAQTAVAASGWDLAFENVSGVQDMGTIRINDGKVTNLFEAANTAAGYDTVDVSQEATWSKLYNSETEWESGAFDEGSAAYGWGAYNPVSHHVEGTVVFVLKYSATSYKKIMIQDYFGGFTFKYATWDGTAWSADTIATVANTVANVTEFTYFSLDTNAVVPVAPAGNAWDMVFTKYVSDLGGGTMYPVTGVLHNSNSVMVAEIEEAADTANPVVPATDEAYSDDINTIGYDWKSFNGSAFVIAENQTFYVKEKNNNAVYRLYFTSFTGASSGNLTFNTENVTPEAGLNDINENMSFGVYPNPSNDGKVTLMYDLKNTASDKNTVSIYSLTGAKVFETSITNNAGFYTKDLNLSNLSAGIYMLNLQAGNQVKTQKLVIR